MNIGDVIRYPDEVGNVLYLWRVASYSEESETFTLVRPILVDGTIISLGYYEVAWAAPGVEVVSTPLNWPFVSVPIRAKAGQIVCVRRGETLLKPLIDWAPSDFNRAGGPIFFSPELRLLPGEVLSAQHLNTSRSRISIKMSFGSVQRRKERATKPTIPKKVSAYDKLTEGLFDDD